MKNILTTMLIVLFLSGCSEELVGTDVANTPISNFEYFWKAFNTRYGLFEVKNIDWNRLYDIYRPQVTNSTTDQELYEIFKKMINELNDNHVNLYPTTGSLPVYPGGLLRVVDGKVLITKVQEDYDFEIVKHSLSNFRSHTSGLSTGTLSDDIAYLNIKGTDSRKTTIKAMNEIIATISSAKALVIDIRGFYGGDDAITQLVAGHFTSEKKLYMITRKRNGPKQSDFTDPEYWYVSPQGNSQFTKPIILLTSRFSQSTAETFALAMNELENVRLLGDTTAGSYSDNPTSELPNGWMFSFSVGDFRAADGKSYEGIGTAPDLWMVNTKDDLFAGKDRVLEKAIELLR